MGVDRVGPPAFHRLWLAEDGPGHVSRPEYRHDLIQPDRLYPHLRRPHGSGRVPVGEIRQGGAGLG